MFRIPLGASIAALLCAQQASAQESPHQAINPYQDLWSFQLENRFFTTQGTLPNASQFEYDLRSISILPVALSDDWMWISIPILELSVSPLFSPISGQYTHPAGFTDLQYLSVLTPKKERGFNFGLGPAVILPTATITEYGFGKWQLGFTAAINYIDSNWTTSVAVAQEWSVAGDPSQPSTSLLQGYIYVARNLADGWRLSIMFLRPRSSVTSGCLS